MRLKKGKQLSADFTDYRRFFRSLNAFHLVVGKEKWQSVYVVRLCYENLCNLWTKTSGNNGVPNQEFRNEPAR